MVVLAGPRIPAERPALRAEWRRLALLGLLGVAGFSMLLYLGLQRTTAVNGLLVQAAQPSLTMLAMAALVGERPTARMVVGLVVSLAGVTVIVARGSFRELLALSPNPGDLLILARDADLQHLHDPPLAPVAARSDRCGGGNLHRRRGLARPCLRRRTGHRPAHDADLGQRRGDCLHRAVRLTALAYIAYNRTVAPVGPTRAGSVTNPDAALRHAAERRPCWASRSMAITCSASGSLSLASSWCAGDQRWSDSSASRAGARPAGRRHRAARRQSSHRPPGR